MQHLLWVLFVNSTPHMSGTACALGVRPCNGVAMVATMAATMAVAMATAPVATTVDAADTMMSH